MNALVDHVPQNFQMSINGEPYDILSYPFSWPMLPENLPPAPFSISHVGLNGAGPDEPGHSYVGQWELIFGTITEGNTGLFGDSSVTGDTEILITYEVPLSSPLVLDPATNPSIFERDFPPEYRTLGAYLKHNPKIEVRNQVFFNYHENTWMSPQARIGWPIFKNIRRATEVIEREDGTYFKYEVILNPGGRSGTSSEVKNRFSLFREGQPAMFYDEFDPRLEYVPGTFCAFTRSAGNTGDPPWGGSFGNQFLLGTTQVREALDQPGYPFSRDVTITDGNKLSFNLHNLIGTFIVH